MEQVSTDYLEFCGREVPARPERGRACRAACASAGPHEGAGPDAGPGTATGRAMGQRQADQTMTLAGMNILLAEDNPTNQMVAVQMLESLGAEVTLASDGAEALGILGQREFDVALIDIEMPRISGIDLIRRVRAEPGPAARHADDRADGLCHARTARGDRNRRRRRDHRQADSLDRKVRRRHPRLHAAPPEPHGTFRRCGRRRWPGPLPQPSTPRSSMRSGLFRRQGSASS